MPHFVFVGRDRPDGLALRRETRDRHLAFLREQGDAIVAAGPIVRDGAPIGSMLVIEAEDHATAEALLTADPYRQVGLFQTTELESWTPVIMRG